MFNFQAFVVAGYVHGGGGSWYGLARDSFEEAEADLDTPEAKSLTSYGDHEAVVIVTKKD